MGRGTKRRTASRIKHSLTIPELLVRLFVGAVCLGGVAIFSLRFYEALRLRIKQRALVASVETQGIDKSDLEKLDASSKHESEPSSARTVVSGPANGETMTAPDATPIFNAAPSPGASPVELPALGKGSSNTAGIRRSGDKNADALGVVVVEQQPMSVPQKEPADNLVMEVKKGSRVDGSAVSPKTERMDGAFALPRFEIEDLSTGRSYDPIEAHKGKVMILDFWASWCSPCLEEMKLLQGIFGGYDPEQFQLISVNTEESKAIVDKAVEAFQIGSQVGLDPEGSVAGIFGVEALPTLVLIDQAGTVQRIHVGLEQGLGETVQVEVDRLLSGQKLTVSEGLASRLFLANSKRSTEVGMTLPQPAESLPSHEGLLDIVLANGQLYSVGDHLAEAEERFDRFFAKSSEASVNSVTSLKNEDTGFPTLVFSRRGEMLHGPLMSFHENGKRQSFIHYSFGKRIATLVCWDSAGRPLVMEEYRNGRRDGVRAIFKSCGGACTTAHLWVAEEWRQGNLLARHVGLGGNEVVRHDVQTQANLGLGSQDEVEYRLASKQLTDYGEQLNSDEDKLKKAVREHSRQVKRQFRAEANARLLASSARTHSFASLLNNGLGNASMQAAQRSMFSGPSMMKRNCGRS